MSLTVIRPAVSTDLTTFAGLTLELGLQGSQDKEYVGSLIAQASDAIAAWCGRSFAEEGIREVFHLEAPARSLLATRWPVTSIEVVTLNGVSHLASQVEREDGGILCFVDASGRRGAWPAGRIEVEYTAGYVLPEAGTQTLPRDIERAAIMLVKANYAGRDRNLMVKAEQIEGIGRTEYFSGSASDLPPEVEGLLAPYRIPNIG